MNYVKINWVGAKAEKILRWFQWSCGFVRCGFLGKQANGLIVSAKLLVLFLIPVGFVAVFACTERNPHYNPDAYCEPGERKCHETGVALVCQTDGEWPSPDSGDQWVIECWDETTCDEGYCVPDEGARQRPCEKEEDCGEGDICAALVSHEDFSVLDSYCIAPPNPGGREAGRPCNTSSQCMSLRCTRNVCLEICTDTADCSVEGQVCDSLDLTVDGIRYQNMISGCVP